jgi:hypothetical protein
VKIEYFQGYKTPAMIIPLKNVGFTVFSPLLSAIPNPYISLMKHELANFHWTDNTGLEHHIFIKKDEKLPEGYYSVYDGEDYMMDIVQDDTETWCDVMEGATKASMEIGRLFEKAMD